MGDGMNPPLREVFGVTDEELAGWDSPLSLLPFPATHAPTPSTHSRHHWRVLTSVPSGAGTAPTSGEVCVVGHRVRASAQVDLWDEL